MACATDKKLRWIFQGRLKDCGRHGQFERDSEFDAKYESESILVYLVILIWEMLCDDEKFEILMLQNLIEDLYFVVNVILHTQDSHTEESVRRATHITKVLICDLKTRLNQVQEIDGSIEEDIEFIQSCDAYNIVKEWTAKTTFEPYCYTESRECHVIGLEVDFLRRFDFEKYHQEIKDHLSTEEWICKFLEENFERMMKVPENVHLQGKQVLEQIGFRADCEAVNKILERESTLKAHLHISDLVQMYVRDEFKYNPVLALSHDNLQDWVSMSDMGHDKVHIINLEKKDSISYSEKNNCPHFHKEDENQRILFHGTDHDSARSIIVRGISISHGRKNRDFSSGCGFYLTEEFRYSIEWAFSTTRKPAVLVYRVDESQLQRFSGYSLAGPEKRSKWKDHVKQYRSGKPSKALRKLMKQHGYVEGPRALSFDPAEPKPNDDTYQMCLISNEAAKKMNTFLHSVLFFD